MIKRTVIAAASICALAILASPLASEGVSQSLNFEFQGAYDLPYQGGYDSNGFAPITYATVDGPSKGDRTLGTTWGGVEGKAIIDKQWALPAFVGSSDLTKYNNLALDLSGEVSPVSLNAGFQATLTPLAFLKFSLGGKVGTGWDIGFTGLGYYDKTSNAYISTNFQGVVCQAWASGTFQFDAAALAPGEWNHVIILASPQLYYQYCSLQHAGKAWMWEADDGTDFNGFLLKGSYVLAYQMPLVLNMVGILAEPEGYLFGVSQSSTKASGGWGSDATLWTISAIFNFKLSDTSSIAILPQVKSAIKWTGATIFNQDLTHRVMEGYYWYFNRIAFDYNLKL